jgi:hypothetical protein
MFHHQSSDYQSLGLTMGPENIAAKMLPEDMYFPSTANLIKFLKLTIIAIYMPGSPRKNNPDTRNQPIYLGGHPNILEKNA